MASVAGVAEQVAVRWRAGSWGSEEDQGPERQTYPPPSHLSPCNKGVCCPKKISNRKKVLAWRECRD